MAETCDGCQHYDPWGKRILIIKLGASGDVIRTTPILKPLRDREGPCQVTWITDPISADLLKQTASIDRLLPYSDENCMILQSQEFDLLLNFEKEPRAIALAELVRAKKKLGFASTTGGALSVYNPESIYALRLGLSDELKFRVNQKTYPEIVFEMIGLDHHGEEYEIGLSETARQYGGNFVESAGFDRSRMVAGINTGCGHVFQTKQWTLEGFAGLIDALRERGDCQIVLLGGPREVEFNRQLMEMAGNGVIDAGCDSSIDEFMGLVDLCDLVVTADTMAMHIAIGLRKQVVAIFGPTCDEEVDLFGRGEIIDTDFECSPCYLKTCDKNPTCMMALESSAVAAAADRCLAKLYKAAG